MNIDKPNNTMFLKNELNGMFQDTQKATKIQ